MCPPFLSALCCPEAPWVTPLKFPPCLPPYLLEMCRIWFLCICHPKQQFNNLVPTLLNIYCKKLSCGHMLFALLIWLQRSCTHLRLSVSPSHLLSFPFPAPVLTRSTFVSVSGASILWPWISVLANKILTFILPFSVSQKYSKTVRFSKLYIFIKI